METLVYFQKGFNYSQNGPGNGLRYNPTICRAMERVFGLPFELSTVSEEAAVGVAEFATSADRGRIWENKRLLNALCPEKTAFCAKCIVFYPAFGQIVEMMENLLTTSKYNVIILEAE